jgi:flavoprotein
MLVDMRALRFPKSCVVCCKKCGHDVLTGTDRFPASSIFVVCSLCGEKRRYQPSEVIHGRPHFMVRRKSVDTGRRGPMAARLGSLYAIAAKARV